MTLRRSLHAALAAIIFTVPPAGLFAQTIPGHQPDEVAAVLAALDEYMLAISANDLVAMDSQQTKEGMTYRARRSAWRVANSMWTVEPEACDELRPVDPAMIRPPGE